jgi:hypothetical protein
VADVVANVTTNRLHQKIWEKLILCEDLGETMDLYHTGHEMGLFELRLGLMYYKHVLQMGVPDPNLGVVDLHMRKLLVLKFGSCVR